MPPRDVRWMAGWMGGGWKEDTESKTRTVSVCVCVCTGISESFNYDPQH